MRKYFSQWKCLLCITVAVILQSCVGTNNKWQNVGNNSLSAAKVTSLICGDNVVSNLVIEEASGATIISNMALGDSRGVRAVLQCGSSNYDVTASSDWSSSLEKVLTVNNKAKKGNITATGVGQSYLTVTYDEGKYSAKYLISVGDSSLIKITLTLNKSANNLALGETLTPTVEGVYSDGTSKIINNAILSTPNTDILKISGNAITALKQGNFTLLTEVDGVNTSITGTVLQAQPVGIVIDSAQTNFTSVIPVSVTYRAKFLLSDGGLAEIPANDFDDVNVTSCTLQQKSGDTNIPFIQSGNGSCTISSTMESGVNKLIYSYHNNKSNQNFESSILLYSSDEQVSSILLDIDNDLKNGGMIVGDVYRYHVYAILKDSTKVDITKHASLTANLFYNGADYSNKLIVGEIGYVGPISSPVDDGKGGVIKLTDYITANDMTAKSVELKLSAKLNQFSANFDKNLTVIPNILTINQLSSYFAESIYPLLSIEKKSFQAISGFDTNGNPLLSSYTSAFIPLQSSQLTASALPNTNGLNIQPVSESVDVAVVTNIPRISKVYGSEDPALSIITIACNPNDTTQTISTAEKSVQVTDSSTISRALTVGVSSEVELDASFLDIVGTKVKTTVKMEGTRTWSDTSTTSRSYRLPPQNISLPPHYKGVVVQKAFKSLLGYTGKFDIPLTQDSCIPFTANGNMLGFYMFSPACMKYSNIVNKPDDPIFKRLFSGNNSLNFYMNYASDIGASVDTNIVAVYLYAPNDPQYSSFKCDNVATQAQLTSTGASVATVSTTIPVNLSNKNLVKLQNTSN